MNRLSTTMVLKAAIRNEGIEFTLIWPQTHTHSVRMIEILTKVC